jgi:hypothetical protein
VSIEPARAERRVRYRLTFPLMPNHFDSPDPALLDIATRVPGPAGSLPFTP